MYSPRVWRWSLPVRASTISSRVFSTCVEVILNDLLIRNLWFGILHVCGGDPYIVNNFLYLCKYSPRVWRWSLLQNGDLWSDGVFSTCVEVIPISLFFFRASLSILHVCGGDPHLKWLCKNKTMYSPRVWRWSYRPYIITNELYVFSTCVEVIPCIFLLAKASKSILHVCGGDPETLRGRIKEIQYSPRVWRWSQIS